MRVLIQRGSDVAPGVVRHHYDHASDTFAFRFNRDDITRNCARDLADALSRQAAGWVERSRAPRKAWRPIGILIYLVSEMPGGVKVLINDLPGLTVHYLDEERITRAGALAFKQSLVKLSSTWVQRGQQSSAASAAG